MTQLAVRDTKVGQYSLAKIIDEQLWKSGEIDKVANVTFPVTALDVLPPMHKPSISVISVSADPKTKDTYGVGGGQFGLSKHVVLKILNAAGASYRTQKISPESDLDFIRWTAIVWGRLPDGSFHQAQGSKAWSWEKCQEQMDAGQAKMYRKFADEQTETKAILRAARAFLNIKTAYSSEELAKPFLIARSVPDLDMTDPEIRRMVAQRALDSTFAVYPDSAQALPPPAMAALPEAPTDEEFSEEPDGGTFHGGRQARPVETQQAETSQESPVDPFATPTEADDELTDDELNARLMELGKSPADGGIGGRLMEILAEIGLKTLQNVPHDIRLDILHRAEKAREGMGS